MPTASRPPALGWSWSLAGLGLTYVLPALIVIPFDTTRGLALAVGVLPAAASGLPGPRRARVLTIVLGVAIGASMTIGALLAEAPWVAVPAIFGLSVAAAHFAPRGRLGRLGLGLCLPMVGIGLSFDSPDEAAGLGLLMTVGCLYACLISLLWPARPPAGRVTAPARPAPPATPPLATRPVEYGIRLGLAAAIAAAIGFALELEHVGWACAAVLLVMRPAPEMVRSRGIDRTVSVLIGALAACLVAIAEPSAAGLALTVGIAIVALAGSKPSRRYVTPMFTTYLTILMMVIGNPGDSEHRFFERLLETVLGVALAYVFGVLIPRLRGPIGRPAVPPRPSTGTDGGPPETTADGQSSNSSSRNDRALRFLLLP